MATIIVSNIGGDFNNTSTWDGGVIPTSVDNIEFTNTSGNLTITSGSECLSINLTHFINTIDFVNNLEVYGSVDLGTGGYTQSGSFGISLNGICSLLSNGVSFSRTLSFVNATTVTLLNNWIQSGEIITVDQLSIDLRGYAFTINGILTQNIIEFAETTTSIINLNGTINLTYLSFQGIELNYLGGVCNISAMHIYKSIPGSTITLDTNILVFNTINIGQSTFNLDLKSTLLLNNLVLSSSNITFIGNYGFKSNDINAYYPSYHPGPNFLTLKEGITYSIENNCYMENVNIKTTTSGVKSNLYLRPGCNQLVVNLNSIDIEATGQGINNFYGVITDCKNISVLLENTI